MDSASAKKLDFATETWFVVSVANYGNQILVEAVTKRSCSIKECLDPSTRN